MIDSYEKLTVQMLMSFEWVRRHCNNTRLIYKVDDDTYAHLSLLEEIIAPYMHHAASSTTAHPKVTN